MSSGDEDRCPVAPPPHSCLRSGPIRSRRVTFSQDSEPREQEEEEDPGGGQVLTPPVQLVRVQIFTSSPPPLLFTSSSTSSPPPLLFTSSSTSSPPPLLFTSSSTSSPPPVDLDDVTHHSQETGMSDLPGDGRGHTWSRSLQLFVFQSDRKCGRGIGVSELSVVLGGVLQLVDRYWTGPGSLQRHQQFLGGAYDLLSELLQPAGGRVGPDQGRVSFSELVLLRRKLERSELQLEAMKSRLLTTLKENYELRRRRHFN